MTQAFRLINGGLIDTPVNGDECHRMGPGVKDFTSGFLVARTYGPRSLHQRTSILKRFIEATGNPTPEGLTAQMVIDWWGSLAHLAPSTRQAHYSAIRQFCAHLTAMGHPTIDIATVVKRPRAPRKPPVILTEAEILRFLAWLPTHRDRAMAALMLGCGLRASDTAAVKVEAIDLDNRLLTVTGKGDKTRLVPIPTATVVCVSMLLKQKPMTHGHLIRSFRTGQPLGADHVQQRLTKLLWQSGIKRAAFDGRSSHVLRRTCATVLLESGATVRDVQTILGHESLATTHAYLAVPDARRLVSLIDAGPMPNVGPAA